MFYKVRRRILGEAYDLQVRGVLNTPPMPIIDAPWTIATMVAKRDVLMYLVAMKSFYRRIGSGKLVAIIDRDTPAAARTLMERHLPGLAFVILEDIDPSPCQRGGTWERLWWVVENSAREYTIQVDCDTLVTGRDIDEVAACVRSNTPFTYADNDLAIRTLPEAAAEAEAFASDYVGIVLERAFARWEGADGLRYVRASSGLAGFAKGGAGLPVLEDFHARMTESLGPRSKDWGTEQSGSNFIIANSPGAIVLPFPEYGTFPLVRHPQERAKFLHFVGAYRHRNNYFASQSRRIVGELMEG